MTFSLLVTGAVIGLVYYALQTAEPSFQGKPLSRWIGGLEYENVNPSGEQRAALRAMGETAVTRLISILQRRDPAVKQKFISYARQHPAIFNQFSASRQIIPENIYHAEAATALGEIGPAARAAIPALTAASSDKSFPVASRAKAALIQIRQESIAPLLALLEDPHSTNWFQAAWVVKHLGTKGEAAVPLLISSLQSTNAGVRVDAVSALGGIASRPDISVPALLPCLQDKNPGVRQGAVDALGKFPQAKPQLVPALLAGMQDPDLNVWLGAAFGLEKILDRDEKRTLYIPALVKSLNSPVEMIRLNAAMFLKRNPA